MFCEIVYSGGAIVRISSLIVLESRHFTFTYDMPLIGHVSYIRNSKRYRKGTFLQNIVQFNDKMCLFCDAKFPFFIFWPLLAGEWVIPPGVSLWCSASKPTCCLEIMFSKFSGINHYLPLNSKGDRSKRGLRSVLFRYDKKKLLKRTLGQL